MPAGAEAWLCTAGGAQPPTHLSRHLHGLRGIDLQRPSWESWPSCWLGFGVALCLGLQDKSKQSGSLVNGLHRPFVFLKVKLNFTARHGSKGFMHDNSFNPHFTDVETEAQGTLVAC